MLKDLPYRTIKFNLSSGNIFPQMLMKVPPTCKTLGLEAERYKSHKSCLLRFYNLIGEDGKKVK